MLNFVDYKYTNKFAQLKRKRFNRFFYSLISFSLIFILFIFLTIYIHPSHAYPVIGTQNLNFGFYLVKVVDGKYDSTSINWLSILFSVFAIIYVIACCIFYWIYWNSEWTKYIKNAQLSAFLILSGFLIVAGIVLGFINAPGIDFTKVNFNDGLDVSSLKEGNIDYNFIYYCHFIKNSSGKIYYDYFYLSEYGILSVVVVSCLMLFLVINIVFIKVKRN